MTPNPGTTWLALCCLVTLGACSTHAPVRTGSWSDAEREFRAVIYRSSDGSDRYHVPATGEAGILRADGERQWRSNARLFAQGPDRIRLRELDATLEWEDRGNSVSLHADPVRLIDATVRSEGIDLAVRLYLPEGKGPFPGVVVVHGSGNLSAINSYVTGWQLAPEGFAVAIFDRRGTGRSAGEFTNDFNVLADDVSAVSGWMKEQPMVDGDALALVGYSQGGWVAPLAATRNPGIRAVQVLYGFAESPFMEDRRQCRAAILGGADTLDPALEALVDATHGLIQSNFESDWEHFKSARKTAREQRWSTQMKGAKGRCLAADFLPWPRLLLRAFVPSRLPAGLDWNYDATSVLSKVRVPMHWMLAREDREAPSAATLLILDRLRANGSAIDIDLYSQADHGLLTFDEADPDQVATGYHPDYFKRQVDWLRNALGLPARADAD